jgi:hypothetical protein
MSLAGVRSNRGDSYQTLIAMRWAITILSDAEYQWLDVDSTRWLLDDVVIGKADGSIICCQCKKISLISSRGQLSIFQVSLKRRPVY